MELVWITSTVYTYQTIINNKLIEMYILTMSNRIANYIIIHDMETLTGYSTLSECLRYCNIYIQSLQSEVEEIEWSITEITQCKYNQFSVKIVSFETNHTFEIMKDDICIIGGKAMNKESAMGYFLKAIKNNGE